MSYFYDLSKVRLFLGHSKYTLTEFDDFKPWLPSLPGLPYDKPLYL